MSAPTVKQAFAAIRALGLKPARVDGEWRIRIPGRPAADYFTEDTADAISTAAAMAGGA